MLCIRLKTFSEIWRDRSGAADSHIDGGDAEVAASLVHLGADLDHEIGAIVAHDFGHVRVAQHPPISLQLFEDRALRGAGKLDRDAGGENVLELHPSLFDRNDTVSFII